MTPQDLANDLRSRINPVYAAQLGTESYERRLCAEALEELLTENEALQTKVAMQKGLIDGFTHISAENERLQAELSLTKTDPEITKLGAAKTMQDFMRENRGLREALKDLAATHSWYAFGECRAFGTDKLLTSAEADKLARAALEEKQ